MPLPGLRLPFRAAGALTLGRIGIVVGTFDGVSDLRVASSPKARNDISAAFFNKLLILYPLLGRLQNITHAANGANELRLKRIIYLCTKAPYRDLDHVGVAVKIHVPYL